uniref:Nicotinamide-nucleotide adenylyltransferase n=1 Tax=Steinernema glaseri TaxID=37863 RepID=A0A1I7ZA27_9BILA
MASSSIFNGCRRVVLIACGSFNPPTVMHMRMFECARDYLQQDLGVTVVEGIFSPAADNYAKPDLAKATHRLRMCELVAKDSGWLRADGWECSQKKWTRSLAVLQHHLPLLREKYGGSGDGDDLALVLLCGGDVVDSFPVITPNGEHLWNPRDVQSIAGDFGLIVFDRASSKPRETLEGMNLAHLIDNTVHFTSDVAFPNDVSSTNLRKAIRAGRSIKYCTPDPVCDYIKEQKLYL